MSNILCQSLARQIEEVYRQLPWLDESFDKKFKALNDDNVFIQPAQGFNSIAQILSHLTEWRKELLDRLNGSSEPKLNIDSPNNWIDNESLKKKGWETLRKESDDSQEALLTLLRSKSDDFLGQTFQYREKARSYLSYVEGLLHHDLYHLGQIGLTLKMIQKL